MPRCGRSRCGGRAVARRLARVRCRRRACRQERPAGGGARPVVETGDAEDPAEAVQANSQPEQHLRVLPPDLGLPEQEGHVGALGGPTQPHAAERELLYADGPRVVHLHEAEEAGGVGGVELLCGQKGLRPVAPQVVPELLPGDPAVLLVVHLLEYRPHLCDERLLRGKLTLRGEVSVELAELAGTLDENTRQYVEHPDDDEEDVKHEQGLKAPVDLAQWGCQLVPIPTIGYRK
mmetsp:Transcript_42019/g.109427  ORF Transcript_42019/g.109427 Transcript_42019/m.109427 type:complete len:234 (+) Transcript_42019:470-1171(+)